ncbi:MFS transporter [Mycobacterium sp. OTB74]|jgi:putative MFS transporter|uniref:MFS transporter n=1 Tax=Mycobacterium sp. OTB74 TaxID=1853452 RepID=UPI0024744289|nr:MFS transporter [Mycobacterium sp. OTB74]MDH6244887.1 putative MFS transporter [Mycobacterium sp. OTB74]
MSVQPQSQALTQIGQRLDHLPVGPVHRRVVAAIGLGLFFEVYEIFLASSIAATLRSHYQVDASTLKLLLASTFVGMFVGSVGFGRLADRLGRRRAFILNLVWFSVWSVAGACAPNAWVLVMTRFLAGVGVGAEYPVADSYLADVLPKEHRGRLAAWAYTCSFVAVPVLGFLSLYLDKHTILGIEGWRVLLAVGALGAVGVAALRRGLPESPRWLASRGRLDEAEAAVQQFEAGGAAVAEPVDYAAAVVPAEPDGQPAPRDRLWVSPYRQRVAMLSVFHLCQPFAYYGFGTLAALVLVSRGYSTTSSLLFTALSYLGYPVGSMLAIPLLGWIERKFLIIGSAAAIAVSGVLFATADTAPAIVIMGFLTTALCNVFSNAYHVYQAEIFPTDIRATAVGATYSLSRLSSGLLPFILLPVLDDYGATAMFGVVVAALVVVMGVVAALGPRTSGRNLEDINPV